jgi:hypothetical protein
MLRKKAILSMLLAGVFAFTFAGEPAEEEDGIFQQQPAEEENGEGLFGEEQQQEEEPFAEEPQGEEEPFAEEDQNGMGDQVGQTPTYERPEVIYGMAAAGPGGVSNLGDDNDAEWSLNAYAGGLWEINPFTALKAFGEATANFDRQVMLNANIGANFYPINAAISPYIGGDVGVGYAQSQLDDGFGVDLGATAGILLFRLGETQVNLEGHTHVLLNDIDGEEFPFRYGGRIGILF